MASELIRVRGVTKRYRRRAGDAEVLALDGVDLSLDEGTTLALVGESGSGKTTLARCIAGLTQPDAGEIVLLGRALTRLSERELRPLRRKVQLVFQDPTTALNPRLRAVEIVEEPLLFDPRWDDAGRRRRALELMETVGLLRDWSFLRPLELSGGQRQRLAIARALAAEPRLLILDEAFSGLDLLVQAQIVNLLLDLQAARGLTYLFVSHDHALMARIADRLAVLAHGRIA